MSNTELQSPFRVIQAVGIFVVGFFAFFLTTAVVGDLSGSFMLGTAIGYAAFGTIALLFVRNMGNLAAFGLRGPGTRYLAAAALLGGSFWTLNILVDLVLPYHADSSSLERAITSRANPLMIVAIGIVGPIAEEHVFRGVLMGSLVTRYGTRRGVVISSAIFACYHMSLAQLVPAFLSGLALGALATRTRSLVPGMIAHAFNNTLILLMVRPETGLAPVVDAHPVAFVGTMVAVFAGGVALLLFRAPRTQAFATA
jgi:membrane protease YdiL (CAAX protease family)